MTKPTIEEMLEPKPDALFGRVVSILEQARGNVVRTVNTQMVYAYWSIGREIVQALQGGEERAASHRVRLGGARQCLNPLKKFSPPSRRPGRDAA